MRRFVTLHRPCHASRRAKLSGEVSPKIVEKVLITGIRLNSQLQIFIIHIKFMK